MNTPTLITRANTAALPQWSSGTYHDYDSTTHHTSPLTRLGNALRRFWWIPLLIWALIAIPTVIFILTRMSPEFISTGAIRVVPSRPDILKNEQTQTPFYLEFMRTQAEFIKSTRVLQRAAEDPRLKAYAWFRALPDQIDYLTTQVTVAQVPVSQLITVSVTHQDANAATDIVNSVIDAYSRLITEDEENNVGKSLTIIKQFRDHTEAFLKESQDKLFKLTSDGSSISTDEDKVVITSLLTSSRATLSKLEADQINLQSTLDNLKARPGPDEKAYKDTILKETDPQISSWTTEKQRLQMQDTVLATKKATPDHPTRIEIGKQLTDLEEKITRRTEEMKQSHWTQYIANFNLERARRIADLESDLKSTTSQITALKSRVAELDQSARNVNGKIQPLLNLREQIAEAKDSLKRYNERIQELESQNISPGRVNIGWNASVPLTPKVDKRIKYAALANGGGLFLGFLVLVLVAKLRNCIESSEDLPDSIQPLVVGTVSHAGYASRGLNGRMQRKILGEEMRLVHANLLPPGKNQRRVMLITSPTPGNGKTSIASHLALSLAKSGLEVLLIDADLRKRDLTTMFDVGFRPGLSELVQGQAPELIRPVELLPNFRVMGAGARLERNPVEILQKRPFSDCLAQLQQEFDCIIIDTPPTLVVADARMIAPSCDEILCVVRAQISSSKDITDMIDALQRVTKVTPRIIVNGVEHRGNYYKYKFSYTDASSAVVDTINPTPAT